MSMHSIDAAAALEHLAARDAVMARIIGAVGPFGLQPDATDPFRALARSIVFQQLSGKAASTIFSRFTGLFDPDGGAEREVRRSDPAWAPVGGPFPEPLAILAASDEALRGVGLSRQKVAALRSLAEHFAAGELGAAVFADLDDEEIIRRTTQVRGIGRWSAEMFLMFHLGRPDVLPVNDVGINRAIQKQYGLEAAPKPADVLRIGEPWRPWATVACWYLWRSEDVVI
ncbi:MAG: DNA-3-methyladenine glycosylase 2 family protein [Dehalococcoidia bacterium]|nr:DNA-3-methyladenine glycosylase 2 family protein [Dehalococcoidia bacterium]